MKQPSPRFLALIVVLFFFSCNNSQKVNPQIKDIKELVFASGQLEWDDAYNLTAQTDGVLTQVRFDIGSTVNKGDLIAIIDNKTSDITTQTTQELLKIATKDVKSDAPALQQLQQTILFAENKYAQDKLLEERYKRLYESESTAKVNYENMQLNAKGSLATLNALKKQYAQIRQQAVAQQISLQGQLKNSQIAQHYNQVRVLEAGTVLKKYKTDGDYVRKGEVIATIANQHKVEAVLNVDENSIAKVKMGQLVYVKLNTQKNKVYEGRITKILSAFDQQTQSFICKVEFSKTLNQALFGTQLEANILVAEKKNALLIPRNYLDFGNKVHVQGIDENVQIKTGIISTDYVEVLGGIDKNTILLPLKP